MTNDSYSLIACKIECINNKNIVYSIYSKTDKNDERYIKFQKGTDSFSSKILQAINDGKLIIGEYYAFVQKKDTSQEKIREEIIACLFKIDHSLDISPYFSMQIGWSDNYIIK